MKKKLMAILLVLLIVLTVGLVACDTQKEVVSMSFYVSPQTEYVLGEALNFDGATVEVTYGDGSTAMVAVDSSMVSSYDSSKLGDQILQVTYLGAKLSFTVTVSRPEIESIEFFAPTKTEYILEQNLSIAGGYFLITYVTGATESVDLTSSMCSGYDMYQMGEQTIYVVLSGYSVVGSGQYTINVSDKSLQGIEVTTSPTKDIYYLGDDASLLEFDGGVLFLSYDNGYTEYIDMADASGVNLSDITVSSWDTSSESSYSWVFIEYKGFSAKFTVKVTEKDIYEVTLISSPINQLVGTELDLTGLELFVTYNDYVLTETILGDSENIEVSGYDINSYGNQTLTVVFYSGGVALNTTFDIDIYVDQKSISNVSIIDSGDTYYQNTSILFTDWYYVVEYNNGTADAAQPLLSSMIKLVDSSSSIKNGAVTYTTAGTKKIEVSLQDNISYHEFEVVALEVVALEITPAADATYYRYHDFDVTGITYKVLYNSGSYATTSEGVSSYALTSEMVSGYNMNELGTQELTITYSDVYTTNFTATMSILVVKEVTDALGLASVPTKVSYILGETFDSTGLGINIKYVGEEHEELVSDFANLGDEWIFTCDAWAEGTRVFSEEGTFEVYVTYSGLAAGASENGVYISVEVHNYINIIYTGDLPSIYAGSALATEEIIFTLTYENGTVVYLTYAELMELGTLTNDYNKSVTTIGTRAVSFIFAPADTTRSEIEFSANLNVEASYPLEIEIVSMPDTLIYVLNDNNGIDTTGLVMNILFSNGTRESLTDYTAAGFSTEVVGDVDITIIDNIYGITTTITITIVEATVSNISWNTVTPYITITEGILIDEYTDIEQYRDSNTMNYATVGECVLTINMSNGTSRDISIYDLISEGGLYEVEIAKDYNSFSVNADYITVKIEYAGLYVNMYVKTEARALSGISIYYTDGASKISVIEDTSFDFELIKLILEYDNGTTSMIAMQESYVVNYEGIVGTQDVEISYGGKQCTATVETTAKELVEIAMYTNPKQYYMEGEDFDATAMKDGVLALIYNNGTQETVSFSEASINNTAAAFNINAVRFNSTEFSGTTKAQPIYITYNGFTTTFYVYIFDREYISIEFGDTSDTYTYTYGDSYETEVTLTGYTAFQSGISVVIDPSLITIAYVPYEEKDYYLDYTQYTDHPTEVGKYAIIIVYDADAYGDLVHNYFIDKSKTLVIEKKVIYVELQDTSKIYGAENSTLYINVYGANSSGVMDAGVAAFAYDDTFATAGLFTGTGTTYTVCIYGSVEVYLFTITYYLGSVVVEMTETTNANGDNEYYTVMASNVESNNYEVKYISAQYKVEKRDIILTPSSKSVEYGEDVGTIYYTTSATDAEESGLVEGEILGGTLSREQGDDVGSYAITIGIMNIANTNYNIIFSDITEYVEIYARVIYVQATSVVMVYGDSLPTFTVKYFRDKSATNTADAFASTDTYDVLGALSIDMGGLELNSDVGIYTISPYYLESSSNYIIVPLSGTVTVTQRDLIVVADAVSKVYGEEDVELTYTYNLATEMGGNEGSGAIILEEYYKDGELVLRVYDTFELTLSRIAGEYVGTYTITLNEAGLSNYNIIFTSNKLTITQKELVVVIDEEGLTKTFDGMVGSIDLSYISAEGATATDLSGVILTLANSSRNAGSYNVSISHSSSNYSVSLSQTYTYTINKAIVEIEYLNVDDLVYNGTYFDIVAQVVDSDLRSYYNSDGTERTDEFGNPIKDTVTITLSLTSVIYAGTYNVTPVAIVNADDNYELSATSSVTTSITVAQRTLTIQMNITDGSLNYYQVYNGYSVELYEGDFTVLNTIAGETLNVTVTVVNPISTTVAPSDVRYDDDGSIIGYSIVANQVNNTNYVVVMAEEDYQLVITPEYVTLSIMESMLSKSYDATVPSVSSGVVNPSNTLSLNDIVFTFTRTTADGKDNTSAGTYSVNVSTTNKNFVVSLAESYIYTINQASLTLTITSDTLSKIYDGTTGIIYEDSVRIPNLSGSKPYFHTFASQASFDEFLLAMETIQTYSSALLTSSSNLSLTSQNMTYNTLQTLYNSLTTMKNGAFSTLQEYYLEDEYKIFEDIFTAANYTSTLALVTVDGTISQQIEALFTLLSDAIDAGSISDEEIAAIQTCISNINTLATSVYNIIQLEDTYISFVMQSDDVDGGNCIAAAAYKFIVVTKDFNNVYLVSNTTLTYTITQEIIYVKIIDETAENAGTANYTSTYGSESLNTLTTEFYDNQYFEGDPVEIDIIITAQVEYTSSDTNSAGYLTSGEYKISYVAGDSGSYSINYVIQYYIVEKKEISITVTNEQTFTYGDVIKVSDVNNSYSIDTALVTGDSSTSIITSGASWSCLDSDGVTIFNKADGYVNAGTYDLYVSGFSSVNYSFVYNAGEVVVNKAVLSLATTSPTINGTSYTNVLTRTYGEIFEPSYRGLIGDDSEASLGLTGVELYASATSALNVLNTAVSNQIQSNGELSDIDVYIINIELSSSFAGLDNYELDVAGTYNLYIYKKQLQITMTSTVGSTALYTLEAIYGETPDYAITLVGLYDTDTSMQSLYETELQTNGEFFTFDFTRDVGNSIYQFGSGEVVDVTEYLINTAANIAFNNYELVFVPVDYEVTARPISIGFDKDFFTTYDEGSISMYLGLLASDASYIELVSGDYSWYNFVFEYTGDSSQSAFAYDETMISVFELYNTDREYTYDTDSDGEVDTYYYTLDYAITPMHSLQYSFNVGTSEIKLQSFSFSKTVNGYGNYDITYVASALTVYGSAVGLSQASDNVILESSETTTVEKLLSNLEITVTYEDGTKATFSVSTDGVVSVVDSSGISISTLNINQVIDVKFSAEYSIADDMLGTAFATNKTHTYVDGSTVSISGISSTAQTWTDEALEAMEVIIRIYSTSVSSVDTGVDTGTYDTADSSATQYEESTTMYNYDEIETTIRIVPSVSDITYIMAINSNVAISGTQLTNSGSYAMMFIAESGVAASTYLRVYADGSYYDIAIDLGTIDLFDGFTHKIYAHYDKRLSTVLIIVDNYCAVSITIPTEDQSVTEDDGSIININGYIAQDLSYSGFAISGSTLYVSKFNTNIVGYSDTYATYVRATLASTKDFVVTNYDATATVTLRDLFDLYKPSSSAYYAYYYVDGSSSPTLTVSGQGTSSGSTTASLGVGYHTVTMVVMDGIIGDSANVVSTTTAEFYVTISQSAVIYNNGYALGTPSSSNVIELENTTSSAQTYTTGDGYLDVTSVEVSFVFDHLDDAVTGDTSTMIITLYEFTASSVTSYIRLVINYTKGATTADDSYTTTLQAKIGTSTTNQAINDIYWVDGSLYTISLYIDCLTYQSGTSSYAYGTYGFKVVIADDGVNKVSYTNSDMNLTDVTTLAALTASTNYKQANISLTSAKLSLYKVQYNGSSAMYNNYLNLGTGAISMLDQEDGIVVEGTEVVLADGNGNAKLDASNFTSYTFTGTAADNGTITMYAAQTNATATQSARGAGYSVVYEKETTTGFNGGTSNTLSFQFYNGSTKYIKQLLLSDYDLLDGNEHTITIRVSRTPVFNSDTTPTGATNFASGVAWTYLMVNVVIDGTSTIAIMPATNDLDYWYTEYATWTTTTDSTIATFIPVFTYASIATDSETSITLDRIITSY